MIALYIQKVIWIYIPNSKYKVLSVSLTCNQMTCVKDKLTTIIVGKVAGMYAWQSVSSAMAKNMGDWILQSSV